MSSFLLTTLLLVLLTLLIHFFPPSPSTSRTTTEPSVEDEREWGITPEGEYILMEEWEAEYNSPERVEARRAMQERYSSLTPPPSSSESSPWSKADWHDPDILNDDEKELDGEEEEGEEWARHIREMEVEVDDPLAATVEGDETTEGLASKSHWCAPGGPCTTPPVRPSRKVREYETHQIPRVRLPYLRYEDDEEEHQQPDALYRELARLRVPMIIENSELLKEWRVYRHPDAEAFEPANLIKRFPHLPVLTHPHSQPSFATFHENKPFESLSGLLSSEFNRKNEVPAECVLKPDGPEEISNQKCINDDYHYFSLRFTSLPDDFLASIQPLSPLLLTNSSQQNLWLGPRGLITHTHFDLQYNFFTQVHGTKTFTLFPPDTPLNLYPNLHPHQAHIYPAPHNESDAGQRLYSHPRYVAELKRGDLLIVPPLWFHHVKTTSQSMSINVWSDAEEYTLMREIYQLPVPLETDWSLKDRLTATGYVVKRLIINIFYPSVNRTLNNPESQGLWGDWLDRWVGRRYSSSMIETLSSHLPPVTPSELDEIHVVTESLRACRAGVCESYDNVWANESIHGSRWQRLQPIIDQFRAIREITRSIETPLTRELMTDHPSDLYAHSSSDQSEAITSLLLANYIEWLFVTMLGPRYFLHYYPLHFRHIINSLWNDSGEDGTYIVERGGKSDVSPIVIYLNEETLAAAAAAARNE